MKCPTCGADEVDGVSVCTSCGTALDRTTVFDPAKVAARLAAAAAASQTVPSAPPAEVEARCLLSSVLSAPIRLEDGGFYRIGRDRTSDLHFPSTHVSRIHAEIVQEKGEWAIVDLGSRNGTYVNGQRTLRRVLKNGDRIGVGHFEVVYRELTKSELDELRGKKSDKMADTLKLSQDAIGFFGDVKKLSIVEVVQLLGQNRKTGILAIQEEKGAPERRLSFLEGTIIHAEFGSVEGERAVLPILRTRTGKFAFRPTDEAVEKITIETPTASLLFQAMEAQTSGTPQGQEG